MANETCGGYILKTEFYSAAKKSKIMKMSQNIVLTEAIWAQKNQKTPLGFEFLDYRKGDI